MAARLTVRRNAENVQNSLRIALLGFFTVLTKVQCYYSVTNASQSVFSGKIYCEACYQGA